MTSEARALDYEKLRAFLVQAVNDVGAATLGALSYSATGWICSRRCPRAGR
jgi:hypothetical protein